MKQKCKYCSGKGGVPCPECKGKGEKEGGIFEAFKKFKCRNCDALKVVKCGVCKGSGVV